jgi:hypothetical protein
MPLLIVLLAICAAAASFMWRFRRSLERQTGPWIAAPAGETPPSGQLQRPVAHGQNADVL